MMFRRLKEAACHLAETIMCLIGLATLIFFVFSDIEEAWEERSSGG
jgi:hypothetical protein